LDRHREERGADVADVVFVLLTVGFFGLCVAYVRGLDRLLHAADDPHAEARTEATGEVSR
jgi:hypothetical protein